LPWEEGNTALAGHRDTFFRRLEGVRIGDEVHLATPHGDLTYRVYTHVVVDPDDVWVLAPSKGTDLTLITCYPFRYVGSAPRRFVVRATRSNGPGM
jgi:sortase A